ncbi:BPSS1780 family membrane protein [Burkholderia gladioli]|uniref:BPSS1780 family membrane protein n=1 Tax=Burkholderia gladioli TaxID=28095 RepID=UPI001641288F|nr:BPSS1780 family membrane protein [Burkholderia gladioli]
MQLIEVPAKTGYVWFRQGIWLFRRNPLAFITLFFTYLLAMMIVSLVPVIGPALPLLFIPGISVGFMAACRDAVAGKPVLPTVLIDGFRAYGSLTTQRLFTLGGIYIVSIALVFACSAFGDGGMLLRLMFGLGDDKPDPNLILSMGTLVALLICATLYVPVAMMFWFAPVLTAWHEIPPVKALFFSVVSCWRNRWAFTLYGLLWFAVATGASFSLAALLQALGVGVYAMTIMMPVSVVITAALYCSFYATYRGCFGVQERGSTAVPPQH